MGHLLNSYQPDVDLLEWKGTNGYKTHERYITFFGRRLDPLSERCLWISFQLTWDPTERESTGDRLQGALAVV